MQVSPSMFLNTTIESSDSKNKEIRNSSIEFEACVTEAQDYIAKSSSEIFESLDDSVTYEERRNAIISLIGDYIQAKKPIVKEYIHNGRMDNNKLRQKLTDEILNYGILTDAMYDSDVTEIRINQATVPGGIWVEKNGRSETLKDIKTGQPIYFKSNESATNFINTLLRYSKTSIDLSHPLANGSTIEGYRISATHPSGSARTTGSTSRSPSCTIRKFSKEQKTLSDLVMYKTLTSDMAKFLALLPKTGLTAIPVGATGSGKTVLLTAMVMEAKLNKRVLLIQSPAEIDMSVKDSNGVELRDYVSWEAKDGSVTDGKSSPLSYERLMEHSMRNTPMIFVFGELRKNIEFALSAEAAASGHIFYTTFHAESAEGAINRYTGAVVASGQGTSEGLTKQMACDNIRFIITIKRLDDGTRKVLSIEEICGSVNENGIIKPVTNTIFKYIVDPNANRDAEGKLIGRHVQCGTVSQRTKNDMIQNGATPEDMKFINREASPEKMIEGVYEPLTTLSTKELAVLTDEEKEIAKQYNYDKEKSYAAITSIHRAAITNA